MTSETQGPLLDRHHAALRAGVTYQTIRLWERAGRLHPVAGPDGADLMILVSELDQAAERSKQIDPALIWRDDELDTPATSG